MKKSGSIGIALFAAVVLASPALMFAGGQPNKVTRTMSRAEMQDRTGISRNVSQGKGAGISRKQVVSRANTSPSQTYPRSSGVDTAFSK